MSSNVAQAHAQARSAQRMLRAGDTTGAVKLTLMALCTDPDCWHAAALSVHLCGCVSGGISWELLARALLCLAHGILRISSAARQLRPHAQDRHDLQRALRQADRQLAILNRWFQILQARPIAAADQVNCPAQLRLLLTLLVAEALRHERKCDQAFRRLLGLPPVADMVKEVAGSTLSGSRDPTGEVIVRLWQLLFTDGTMPAVLSLQEWIAEIQQMLLRRVRDSNSPDGRSRMPGFIELREDLIDPKDVQPADDPEGQDGDATDENDADCDGTDPDGDQPGGRSDEDRPEASDPGDAEEDESDDDDAWPTAA